ncbi:zinc finger MIZ domain-containing protein 2 [Podospora australis]|uniref:Zinc finger MIZ domain-containing protein 2 n=1 Tax=Podospora australis TaxID=1536484 RepID=A0AAN6WTG3_9PEZI|nr:zinc finger MIZ domain-containing protein 2 [Podospora australis]
MRGGDKSVARNNKSHSASASAIPLNIQVASTNATASAFVSGRPRPDWLSSPATGSSATGMPVVIPVAPAVLPSPAPSDELSPSLANAALDSPTLTSVPDAREMQSTTTPVLATAPMFPTNNARFVHDNTIDTSNIATQASWAAPGLAAPNSAPGTSNAPIDLSDPQYLMQRQQPPLSSYQPAPTNPTASTLNLPISELQPLIEQHVAHCGGEGALNPHVERPRFTLLKEACRENDFFFLVLHQLYALWSTSHRKVHEICSAAPSQTVDAAFGIIEGVLKKNEMLHSKHRRFFETFPCPFSQAVDLYPDYNVGFVCVETFLGRLVQHHGRLSDSTKRRRYPYLVDELISELGCYSPVLQLIFFTSNRRQLGIPEGVLAAHIENAFKGDQQFYSSRGVGPVSNSNRSTEIEQRNAHTIAVYNQIMSRVPSQRHTQSLPAAQAQSRSPSLQSPLIAGMTSPHLTLQQGVSSPTSALPSELFSRTPPQQQSPFAPGAPWSYPMASQRTTGIQPSAGMGPQQRFESLTLQPQQQQQQQHQQLLQQQHRVNQPAQQYRYSVDRTARRVTSQPGQFSMQAQQASTPAVASPTNAASHTPTSLRTNVQRIYAPQGIQQPTPVRQKSTQLLGALIPDKNVVIPRPEWPYDTTDRKAIHMSLHQAHLRSPKRVLREGDKQPYFQAMKSFAVEPTAIIPRGEIQTFEFVVQEEQFALAATSTRKQGTASVPQVQHFNGALRWRVRCCKGKPPNKTPTESEWVTLDMSWPSNIFISLNGKTLEARRQPHNGKDLATELTDHIRCGTNILEVSVPVRDDMLIDNSRFLAVELLETLDYSHIMQNVRETGLIPEEQTLRTIKQRLAPPADDDGLVIEAPDLSIDLACPFSALIWKIPARGASCTHLECFDLETWLKTRPAKPVTKCLHAQVECDCVKTPEPSNPDKWRCPVCLGDARPYSLRIDEFLLNVREELARRGQGKIDTKCMHVKADGTWSVVVEEETDTDTDDDRPPAQPSDRPTLKRKASSTPIVSRRPDIRRQEVEVIELD